VGQGDSALIISSSGLVVLVDGGPKGAGENVILPFLKSNDIRKIDYYIVTHYDADHLAGVIEVIAGVDGIMKTSDDYLPTHFSLDHGEPVTYHNLFNAYETAVASKRRTAEPGDELDLDDNASLMFYVSHASYVDGANVAINDPTENDLSLVFLLTVGDASILFEADLPGGGKDTVDLETHLGELIGAIDILKVSHHGSDTSSNDFFLNTICPRHSIISVGENGYGLPNESVISRLLDYGNVAMTDGANITFSFFDEPVSF